MLTVLGILMLVAGAILTFAVDRQADGVDLQAVGWILMGGGGLSLLAEMIRIAGVSGTRTATPPAVDRTSEPTIEPRPTGRRRPADRGPMDRGRLERSRTVLVEDRSAA